MDHWVWERESYKKAGQIEIPVISSRDLVEMKRDSRRPQDRVDVQYLEKLLGREDGKNRP